MTTLKYSRQREAIIQYLGSTTTHPTAETIYENISKIYPNISLGTVYRNLNLLVSQNQILRLSCGDGKDRFDGNPTPHNHFLCTQCHLVLDLDMEPIDHINIIANAKFHGKVEGHVTYFYGLCEECLS